MLACQGCRRDKYTDVSTSTSAYQTSPFLSLAGRSPFLSICLAGETVLADWLIYYIQATLFVKDFARSISKFVLDFF
jgi:hypothetical protein